MRNLLHSLVFTKSNKKTDEKSTSVGFFSTPRGRGFLSFLVSGAFHELIICSVCRQLTLENFCFFTLHGLACMFIPKKNPQGLKRVGCIIAQLSFMIITGRLFLAPFLRTRFTEVLPLTFYY